MPGIDKENIQVNLADKYVSIHAEKGDKKYHTDIPVNVEVGDSVKAIYTNGILELKIKLKEASKPKGKTMKERPKKPQSSLYILNLNLIVSFVG
jgi:HSP20 family protein